MKILNDNYEIGRAKWDTGFCYQCGKEMNTQDRKQAAINMLTTGIMYFCEPCSRKFFDDNQRMVR